MLNTNTNALGIIFPNSYDLLVPELVNIRLMASIPFASRYRLIDFTLSGMTHSDIGNVSIMVNNNYHSLMDHLGSGREWDLVRKNGGLNIFPPFAEKEAKPYVGRVGALAGILNFLKNQKETYVILTDANIAVNFDFKAMIQAHIDSGADVTIAYTFNIDDGRVTKIYVNSKESGVQNFSMNMYVLEREFLISLIEEAYVHGHEFFERDILVPKLNQLNVQAYKCEDYIARISDLKSYFDENMKLLDDYNLNALFSGPPIYTKLHGGNPTRYIDGCKAQNVMAADGCIIEGEVENSILFRSVKIAKGAKVRNCVLMQGTVVEAGADIEYLVTDKNVTITAGKEMKGTDSFPVYIGKNQTV